MPIEAISERSINETPSNEMLSSTWDGKDVSCPPLEPTDAVIRAIAFLHLQLQKEGIQTVREFEQVIYTQKTLEEEEDELASDDELDEMIQLGQSLACDTTSELLRSEERVRILLHDPVRSGQVLLLYKPILKRMVKKVKKVASQVVKPIRRTGRKINEFAKNHASGGSPVRIASIPLGPSSPPSNPRSPPSHRQETTKPYPSSQAPKEKPLEQKEVTPSISSLADLSQQSFKVSDGSLNGVNSTGGNFPEGINPAVPVSLPALAPPYPLGDHRINHQSDLQLSDSLRNARIKPSAPTNLPTQRPPLNFDPAPPLKSSFTPTWTPQQSLFSTSPFPLQHPSISASQTPLNPIPYTGSSSIQNMGPPTTLPPSGPVAFFDPDAPVRVYKDATPPPKSTVFEVPGTKLKRGCIGGINGIGNNLEEAQKNASYLSQLSRNHHIEWTHNRSHSALVDTAEVLLNFLYYSAPAKLLKENWEKFHEEYKNDSSAKYLQYCHSQGAIHVRNALAAVSPEIRDRIIVVAIAPAVIVPDDLCFSSFNYASKNDPIPITEGALTGALQIGLDAPPVRTIEMFSKEVYKELILLDPHPDAPKFDHAFTSPTFKDVIEEHLKSYISQYGPIK